MIVMLLENVPPRLRGELTRWLIEPRSGVFVGHVNAMVRDRLWEKCQKEQGDGGVVQIWSTNNEQRFFMRMAGNTDRKIVEMEGLQLIGTAQSGKDCLNRPPNMADKLEKSG